MTFQTPELIYCSPIVAFLLQNSFITHRLSRSCSRTPLLLSNCRVLAPELLYCSPIVAFLRQNSFIAQQLSRSCTRTPLLLTDCRVLTPELLYRSAIVAFWTWFGNSIIAEQFQNFRKTFVTGWLLNLDRLEQSFGPDSLLLTFFAASIRNNLILIYCPVLNPKPPYFYLLSSFKSKSTEWLSHCRLSPTKGKSFQEITKLGRGPVRIDRLSFCLTNTLDKKQKTRTQLA